MTLEFEEIVEPFVDSFNEDLSIQEIKRLVNEIRDLYGFTFNVAIDIWSSNHQHEIHGSIWWALYHKDNCGSYASFSNAYDVPRFLRWLLLED